MREKVIKIYTFDELSEEAQQKAIDTNRYNEVEEDWWEFAYEIIREGRGLLEGGSTKGSIHFSLDRGRYIELNAQFFGETLQGLYKYNWEGSPYSEQIGAFFEEIKEVDRRVLGLIETGVLDISVSSAERDTSICLDLESLEGLPRIDEEYAKYASALEDLMEGIQDKSLDMLQQEYDYLVSDDCVRESLIANKSEFLEDGTNY